MASAAIKLHSTLDQVFWVNEGVAIGDVGFRHFNALVVQKQTVRLQASKWRLSCECNRGDKTGQEPPLVLVMSLEVHVCRKQV